MGAVRGHGGRVQPGQRSLEILAEQRLMQYAAAYSFCIVYSRHFYCAALYCIDFAQIYAICVALCETS